MAMKAQARSGPRSKVKDPYVLAKAYPEPTVCPVCHLVYHKKHWSKDDAFYGKVKANAEKHACPACRKIEDRYAMGILHVAGDFSGNHKEQVIQLIRNHALQEYGRNPLDRIMNLVDKSGEIVVETTSEHLVMSLGRALERAFGGSVRYAFSQDEKNVRVYWQKEEKGGRI
jgi:hypothetical protein